MGELLKKKHKSAVSEGQSACVDNCNNHFIAYVDYGGDVYELDGCKEWPVNHGPVGKGEHGFLRTTLKVIRALMDRDPKEVSYGMLALGKVK